MRRRDFLKHTLAAPGLASGLLTTGCGEDGPSAVVGAKTYSEQIILGEIMSQLLEAEGLPVTPRFQMQTFVLHTALESGDLDCYVEYSGTSYSAIMGETFVAGQTADEIYDRVQAIYRERYDLRLGPPLGFSNDYVVVTNRERAEQEGIRTISDLAARTDLLMVAGYPFFERDDGFRGMLNHYDFQNEPETIQVDLDMVWGVIEAGQADVAVGNSTDGRIAKLDLTILEDDRNWFPPYQSGVVYHPQAPPQVAQMAAQLGGTIDGPTMRTMNQHVDLDGETPATVATHFLTTTTNLLS